MKLSYIRVQTWPEAYDLLAVRNLCAGGMTAHTAKISVEQQWRFWKKNLMPGHYEAYLILDAQKPLGYGLLHVDHMNDHGYNEDIYWMTAGLVPEARGKGLSRYAIALITETAHAGGRVPWIEVYDWNLALINDVRVGYRYVSERQGDRGRILIMRHKHDRETEDGYAGIPGYTKPTGSPQ